MRITTFLIFLFSTAIYSQEVPIVDFAVDSLGKVQIKVHSTSEYYYILYIVNDS